jgi:hypothetical protein
MKEPSEVLILKKFQVKIFEERDYNIDSSDNSWDYFTPSESLSPPQSHSQRTLRFHRVATLIKKVFILDWNNVHSSNTS